MRILITGTTGFIGRNLALELNKSNKDFFCTFRNGDYRNNSFFDQFKNSKILNLEKIDENFFDEIKKKIDVVVYCAGQTDSLKKNFFKKKFFFNSNFLQVKKFAKLAAKSGVKKFIFLSSIAVYGKKKNKFQYQDIPAPDDDYARSKLKGEEAIIKICKSSEMNFVIIRPPAVYGPGVKGNFNFILNLVYYSIPMPFKNYKNLRSFIGIKNLVDFIIFCISSDEVNNKKFLICDFKDMTLSFIVKKLSHFMKKNNYSFSLSSKLLFFLCMVTFNMKVYSRIMNTSQIDHKELSNLNNWRPKYSPEQEIEFMVKDFMINKK